MGSKLTLSVDPVVLAAARRYAAEQGTSVSSIVERYLADLTSKHETPADTPVLRRLRGCLSGVSEADHKDRLREKYGT